MSSTDEKWKPRWEPTAEVLKDWQPVLIRITNEPFTGLSYNVPGWKCTHCGAQYGCVIPPDKCWKCEEKNKK